ncbi:hypothetical protein Cpir12675_003316 [Ceratocystis pirilliformis]|uniref:Hydroxyacyl-thioester dehydratase type 2 mitochondrial n=1 Tax=Ceratocystis pirilliformis TaxID=259994 RepID=A0ABR3Z3U1_9PEZI
MQTLRASLSRPLCSQRWTSSWSAADLQTIKTKLVSQPPKIIDDFLTPTQSHLLSLSLTGASRSLEPCARPSPYASASFAQPLPYGAHLVHFPIRATPQELYPDGTDADHLPHELLPKRMWEGGEVQYSPTWRRQLIMDGRRAVCVETIGDVRLARNSQYILVDVWRSYTAVDGCRGAVDVQKALDNAAVRERRTLVFMPKDADVAAVRRRPVKCPWTPQHTQVFTPSYLTLFNFSALTYNAHRIHYTSGYDGFSRPVVHGPLTQALMLHVLNSWLPDINIESLKYSNLAPLFAGDQLSVCLAQRDGTVRLWITGPDGGMAVKGTVIEAGSE